MKDISWLWRSAYNSAVQGCSEWENCSDQIAELFDAARIVSPLSKGCKNLALIPLNWSQLLETWCQASPLDIDDEIRLYLISATFSAVSAKGAHPVPVLNSSIFIFQSNLVNPKFFRREK
jgi:hypothetical protein